MMRRLPARRSLRFLVCWTACVLGGGLAARHILRSTHKSRRPASESTLQQHEQAGGQRAAAEGQAAGSKLQNAQARSSRLPRHMQQKRPKTKWATTRAPSAATRLAAPPNIPAVWDVFTELSKYEADLFGHPETQEDVVKAAQHRTTAADLGIMPSDDLRDLHSIAARISFLNTLANTVQSETSVRLAVVTTWGGSLAGVRHSILPWLQVMTELGITSFYILYDGTDSAAVDALSRIRHVKLQFAAPPFASEVDVQEFARWEKRHWQWGSKPGNFKLMVKQGFGMERGLRLARQHRQDWLMHLDPDEIVCPTQGAFNLATVLQRQPDHVSSVRFLNVEGQAEVGDIINRLEQVTLFRTHQHHATPQAYKHRFNFRLGDNRSYLLLYANGKSAVRVVPGVRQLGPHYWRGTPSARWRTSSNPDGQWQTHVSEDAVVLHYAYVQLSDVADKAAKSCPYAEYLAAAHRGDRAKVKDCFIIDLDQDAYMVAATGDKAAIADFFWSRMVFAEGSRVRCKTRWMTDAWCILRDVDRLTTMLMRVNLLIRVHGPSIILKQHEREIRLAANATIT